MFGKGSAAISLKTVLRSQNDSLTGYEVGF